MTSPEIGTQSRPDTLEAHRRAIERVVLHMRSHLSDPLDLEQLARIAFISKFHFLRVFEGVTGTTPHNFLTCLRIQRAKELLLNSEASVTEICMEVGYSSLGSFSTTFAASVGVCPKEFRALPTQPDALEFAPAVQRFLAAHRAIAGPELEGVVEAPAQPRGFIFVGTFSRGVPQGPPDSGTVLLSPGVFRIRRPAFPEFHLLAVLLPFSAKVIERVASLPVTLVARLLLRSERPEVLPRPRLRLRPMALTDPPIVTTLPALLGSPSP